MRARKRMDPRTLDLVYEEVLRRRDIQSKRVSSIRARSAGVLGAAGLAATLVSATSATGWYVWAILCFVLAAIYAVKSMRLAQIPDKSPARIVALGVGCDEFDFRANLVKVLDREYKDVERVLDDIAQATRSAMSWFVAGTVVVLFVSSVFALLPVFTQGG